MASAYPARLPGNRGLARSPGSGALPGPLLAQQGEVVLVGPLPLEPLVLHQVRLVPHAQPPQHRRGGMVPRVQPGEDPVQPEVVERDPEHVTGALGGEPSTLEVAVQHVAELRTPVLHAEKVQPDLAPQPVCRVVEPSQGYAVAVDL